MYNPNFKPGDIIEFCDEQFVVLSNFGNTGRVQENCKNGVIINYHWEYQGEKCKLVKDGIDKRECVSDQVLIDKKDLEYLLEMTHGYIDDELGGFENEDDYKDEDSHPYKYFSILKKYGLLEQD